MKTTFQYLKKYIPFAVLASVFMILEVCVDLTQPRMMERIVDDGILGGGTGVSNLPLVVSTGIKMLLIVLAGGACGILSGVFTNITGQNYGNDIRKDCFRRIMHFSFEQMDDFTTGSLITRTTNDVTQVQSLVMQSIRGLVRCLMFFIGGTYALLSLDLSFGTIIACAFPLIILDIVFVVWKTNPLFLLLQERLDRLNGVIQENVNGARVVKAFVQEEREEKRFGKANEDLQNTQFEVQMLLSFLRPVMNIVLNIAVIGVIRVGAIDVQAGTIQPGSVMAAITYLSQILNGMMMLAMIFQTMSRGRVSEKRLREILETEPAIQSGTYGRDDRSIDLSDDKKHLEDFRTAEGEEREHLRPGTIKSDRPDERLIDGKCNVRRTARESVSFRHVSFAYPGNKMEVLHDINLEIHAGETFAIIGATASGKSTLADLIPRFYDATEGEVLVDGVNVKEYDLRALRSRVTVCLQKAELFSTTIRDNIALGRPDATLEDIKRAAKAAQADGFIMTQPEGYDTPVAEDGMSLSGGQRQRISIARALLRGSEIMIFDDSTSALDLKTEAALYQALRKDYPGVTKIFIAQRIASVKNADRILVLDGGTVSGCGTHEELLESNAIYRDICRSQEKRSDWKAQLREETKKSERTADAGDKNIFRKCGSDADKPDQQLKKADVVLNREMGGEA